jgi:cobyrinic acid a,c-diamide synthase
MQKRPNSLPRLVVAGLSGDSGKTVISLGLLLLARRHGIPTAAFKKGPDYIDTAWLSWASGNTAWNLDTYLMGKDTMAQSFLSHALSDGLNVIEGNRGLYDGLDAFGTHSTAELAKRLNAPVLLVINAAKVTRTAAASVLGCQKLDPKVRIAGVILNRVAGHRHETVLRESVEQACHVAVVGAVPKVEKDALMPGRHLGLVTPQEHGNLGKLSRRLLSLVEGQLDFGRILEAARGAPPLDCPAANCTAEEDGKGLKIAYLRDSAFTFYYPDNLESLERSGAQLVPVSSLSSPHLPGGLDALYIGGGFPEMHAAKLSANAGLISSIRDEAAKGLPIYAECGGLMLLSRAVHWRGKKFPMAGVLPFEVEVCATPQGHGYVELVVDRANPYYEIGAHIRGHEFHYSRILPAPNFPPTACSVQRGTGSYQKRDAILVRNVWASYTHVHTAGAPEWMKGFLAVARRFSSRRLGYDHHDSHPLDGTPSTTLAP